MSRIFQFKITLVDSHPLIWRRITVSEDTTFEELHDIIQITMGWDHAHLYEFKVKGTTVHDTGAIIDPAISPNERDALDTGLNELLTRVNTKFTYIYDFGDHWEHQIVLEKILRPDAAPSQPQCVGAEGACPPEDCGGIWGYMNLLKILADKKHPEHLDTKEMWTMDTLKNASFVDVNDINDTLAEYTEAWEEIDKDTEQLMKDWDDEEEDEEDEEDEGEEEKENDDDWHGDDEDYDDEYESEYGRLKSIVSPGDVLNDAAERADMEAWLDGVLRDKTNIESVTLARLRHAGYDEPTSRNLILGALCVEWFYDVKYWVPHVASRYHYNLQALPEAPVEMPSLGCAIKVLDESGRGVPMAALDYLYQDTSAAATDAIVEALKEMCENPDSESFSRQSLLWYTLVAEGHLHESLIDAVIGLYGKDVRGWAWRDWIGEQGEYLIGKLAQKYPDIVAEKVLTLLENEAIQYTGHDVFFLFDVFDFCNLNVYKDRLIALLKRDDLSWHDCLAITFAHLQIQEGLPILKEQLERLTAQKPKKGTAQFSHIVELKEAITQLETGEDPFEDIDTPLCLRRGTTWKEELAEMDESDFYENVGYTDEAHTDAWHDDYERFLAPFANTMPYIKKELPGRNDPCHCGSGKKYKKCCLDKDVQDELQTH